VTILQISSLNERLEKEFIGQLRMILPWHCELSQIEKDLWTFPKEYIEHRRLLNRPI
jgi:hypothetical protein